MWQRAAAWSLPTTPPQSLSCSSSNCLCNHCPKSASSLPHPTSFTTVYDIDIITDASDVIICLVLCSSDGTDSKKAQLSLTNPARHEIMPNLLQFDILTTLSLTILVYIIRLVVVASEMCEIPRNCLTYRVQGHPWSSILVSIKSAYATSY